MLSAVHATLIGLEKSRIIIESDSENTRQHPIEALKVRGVTKNSPIVIVIFRDRSVLRELQIVHHVGWQRGHLPCLAVDQKKQL